MDFVNWFWGQSFSPKGSFGRIPNHSNSSGNGHNKYFEQIWKCASHDNLHTSSFLFTLRIRMQENVPEYLVRPRTHQTKSDPKYANVHTGAKTPAAEHTVVLLQGVQVWNADFRQQMVHQSSLCYKDLTLRNFVVSSTIVRRARVINWKSVCIVLCCYVRHVKIYTKRRAFADDIFLFPFEKNYRRIIYFTRLKRVIE